MRVGSSVVALATLKAMGTQQLGELQTLGAPGLAALSFCPPQPMSAPTKNTELAAFITVGLLSYK